MNAFASVCEVASLELHCFGCRNVEGHTGNHFHIEFPFSLNDQKLGSFSLVSLTFLTVLAKKQKKMTMTLQVFLHHCFKHHGIIT